MRKSYGEVVAEAKRDLVLTQPDELKGRLDAGEQVVLIDVREPEEWAQGTIPGAHTVPRGVLEGAVDAQVPRDATVVLYCAAGNRSALAGRSLKEMGFARVENLEGGFAGWQAAGLPVQRG